MKNYDAPLTIVKAKVREACRRWRGGEAGALWQEAAGEVQVQERRGRRRRPREQEPTQEERNARRAATLIQEGQLSRAARALVSRGMDQSSAQAMQEMMDKQHEEQRAILSIRRVIHKAFLARTLCDGEVRHGPPECFFLCNN